MWSAAESTRVIVKVDVKVEFDVEVVIDVDVDGEVDVETDDDVDGEVDVEADGDVEVDGDVGEAARRSSSASSTRASVDARRASGSATKAGHEPRGAWPAVAMQLGDGRFGRNGRRL
jgi:hypothetical protein